MSGCFKYRRFVFIKRINGIKKMNRDYGALASTLRSSLRGM